MTATQQSSLTFRQRAWHSFKHSNYITDGWNWFMKLLSKSAEPILFFTVLYSGYELLPSVPQPGAIVDAPVFIAQQAALDIGGLGLMKIAKQANLGKESYAYRVGVILIGLMMANVAMASLKKVVPLPPLAFTIIETILLMARAIMAVLYGHAIHALRDDYPQVVSHAQQQPQPTIDVAPLIAPLEARIGALQTQLEALQEAHKNATSSAPSTLQVAPQNETFSETESTPESDTQGATSGATNITMLRTKRETSSTRDKASKAARYMRNNPDITPTELAKKAGISASYARRLLAEKRTQQAVND
ncbi:MAG: hypothetical protein JO202_05855 [Ktedonobacteraceae bacterium]|nr:hypothetical protein [Ktedonobacteraceae bacterium]